MLEGLLGALGAEELGRFSRIIGVSCVYHRVDDFYYDFYHFVDKE
jgi:hypothetical protein